MANPSAVYCEEQGYEYKIITNPDGSQYGMCGTCRAWDFYNGECKQGFNWYSWAPEIGNLTQKQSALIIFGVIGLILFLLVRKK